MAVQLFRSHMTERDKAAFVQANGMGAFLALPAAPPPPPKRSEMTGRQALDFLEKYGPDGWDALPE